MACLLLVALLMVSCGNTSEASIPVGEQELPDMVLRNSSYTLARGSDEPMMMDAKTITIYSTGRDTVLEDVSFRQNPDLSGSCKSAVVSKDNSKAELKGDVTIHKAGDEEITISAQSLVWNNSDNSVVCDGEVLVEYGDGAHIRAIGFSALLDDNKYEFSTVLEGTLSE